MPTRYADDHSSDDSLWNSDSYSPSRRRRSTKKAKSTASTSSRSNTVVNGSVKKPKKPGRKPMENLDELPKDPKLKRKAQNRAAQRAFRERKEQFVNELQQQIAELKAAKEKREKELAQENALLRQENAKLKEENECLKEAARYSVNGPVASSLLTSPALANNVCTKADDEVDMLPLDLDDDAITLSSLSDREEVLQDQSTKSPILEQEEVPTSSVSLSTDSTPEIEQIDSFSSPLSGSSPFMWNNEEVEAPLTMPSPDCNSYCGYSSPYNNYDETDELSDYLGGNEDNGESTTPITLAADNNIAVEGSINMPSNDSIPVNINTTSINSSTNNAFSDIRNDFGGFSTTDPFYATTTASDLIVSPLMSQLNVPNTATKGLSPETATTAMMLQQQASLFGEPFVDLFGLDSKTSNPYSYNLEHYEPFLAEQLNTMDQPNQFDISSINSSEISDDASGGFSAKRKLCRERIIQLLHRAKGTHNHRSIYQINQVVKSQCPIINMDQICKDLGRQINIDDNRVLSDREVDVYIECIARAP
ncbi:hypothetical protein BDF20DRAFT_861656 [Mycotypha africana]|uniref:uncharacterized protein n=1 Tax=Mycotypha africana TaxID=64632 RepID=UPI0023005B8C|nr:uncharacterized protein BDF20DRAFT_861656 [Mycotypha africana]KAI8984766.1 hypothetical protein BDF20DRAFT_861656 [Mycotypha africana]